MLDGNDDPKVKITTGDGETLFEGKSSDMREAAGKIGAHLMKETDEDRAVSDGVYRVAADELRSFVERWERLDADKREIADEQKEVFAEAKGRGYSVPALRAIIKIRKKDPSDLAEEEAVLAMYREALGV